MAKIGRAVLWTLKRFFVTLLILIVFGLAAAGYGWIWLERNVLSTLPTDLSAFRNYRPPTSCRVYAANGVEIDTFYLERRIWVPLDQLPEIVPKAFMAAEDRRFLEHRGVDLFGIARAVWTNLTSGRQAQGGSTITQQLVKNLIVGKERSYVRKLREAALAFRLEKELSKDQILELYLNYVALGSGNYGVEAAAQDYFGLSARDLNAGQAALLAGLVPAPSRYSPRSSPERAARRRELVLGAMVELRMVSRADADVLAAEPVLVPRESKRDRRLGAAYATEVRRELRKSVPADVAASEGLEVHTALDLEIQRVAEEAVRKALAAVESRQGRIGAVRSLPIEMREQFSAVAHGLEHGRDGAVLPPKIGDCFESMVGEQRDLGALIAGPWTFALEPAERTVRVRGKAEGERAKPLATAIAAGDVLRVCLVEAGKVKLDPRPWTEGAAVVIENATGRILAIVGGYEVAIEGFNRATQAHRQPGSSFKPYVYAAALLSGTTQLDEMRDAPLALPAGGGKVWSPKNYDGKYRGTITMRSAFAQSLNTVAVRLTLDVGVDQVIAMARRLGLRAQLRNDPTIALGSSEVTLMDHAMAYSTIARMGTRVDPIFIDALKDADQRVIGAPGGDVVINGQRLGRLSGGPGRQVLPPGVAYELVDMMRGVVLRGTARSASKPGFDRAGKTGTTNGFVDAWFVGFTPRYTVGVWIGTDGTATLGEKETGGKAALPAWIEIVDALPHVEGERFPVPDDAMLVRTADGEWVGLPRGQVPKDVLPVTVIGAEPLPLFEDAPNDPNRRLGVAGTSTKTAARATATSTVSGY
ncbi:PBP1A family penicillin-binding protein [Myxococcota bacterium]|nr:PBP1A family penicillin-binding protein [Myxococcota bacterium]